MLQPDIAFVMEIAYVAAPLKRLRFFMQFPRQALYGHGNAGQAIVQVININDTDNKDFLESCSLLNGYKKFIEKVEKYKALYGDKGYIIAIEECIKEGMEISEYLKRKMKEVGVNFLA